MNGYERTISFVNGQPCDRPPFMPLVIDWAARQEGVAYRDFVEDAAARAKVYLQCTERFDIDCILPDSDFYEQLADFGMPLRFENGRFTGDAIISDVSMSPNELAIPSFLPGTRMGNRLETLRLIAAQAKGKKYIFGTCVGPLTEFCNARGMEDAMMDLLAEPEAVAQWLEFFCENGLRFIREQLAAGADGIQIVEPTCFLIRPALYAQCIAPLHVRLVEAVQADGGIARLHVCGDTNALIPHTLAVGARILDVDYAVRMDEAAAQLAPNQRLCGNLDPVGLVLEGTPAQIAEETRRVHALTGGRALISGGCDIPEATPVENMMAFHDACAALKF